MTPQIFTGLYPHMALGYLSKPIPPSEAEMPEKIIATVRGYFKVSEENLKSKSRKRAFVEARQVAMYFFNKKTRWTLTKIGQEFGGRDHSTVIYARETVEDIMHTNKFFKAKVEEIAELLKN